MKHIVSWSGGKDSTFMLHEMLNRGMHIDEVVCCDTTIEFPEMYEHQKSVVERIHYMYPDIVFTFLKPEHDFEYYMFDYQKKRGSNAGQCGLGWANPNYIWCRKFLKLSVIDDYLINKYGRGNYITYIGIAFDEYDRYDFDFISGLKSYPLIEWKVPELECLHGCWELDYTFGGLYDKFFRVSCWCCPLQSIKDLYMLFAFYPQLWDKLRELDEMQNNRFRKDYSLQELEDMFKDKSKLPNLLYEHLTKVYQADKTKVSDPKQN